MGKEWEHSSHERYQVDVMWKWGGGGGGGGVRAPHSKSRLQTTQSVFRLICGSAHPSTLYPPDVIHMMTVPIFFMLFYTYAHRQ